MQRRRTRTGSTVHSSLSEQIRVLVLGDSGVTLLTPEAGHSAPNTLQLAGRQNHALSLIGHGRGALWIFLHRGMHHRSQGTLPSVWARSFQACNCCTWVTALPKKGPRIQWKTVLRRALGLGWFEEVCGEPQSFLQSPCHSRYTRTNRLLTWREMAESNFSQGLFLFMTSQTGSLTKIWVDGSRRSSARTASNGR